MDIIFSPILMKEHTVLLEVLIMRYFQEFRTAFPGLFYFINVQDIIKIRGPPDRYFERISKVQRF